MKAYIFRWDEHLKGVDHRRPRITPVVIIAESREQADIIFAREKDRLAPLLRGEEVAQWDYVYSKLEVVEQELVSGAVLVK